LYINRFRLQDSCELQGGLNDEHCNFSALSNPLSPSFFVNAELKILFPYGCTVEIEERQADQKQTDTKRKQEGRKQKERQRIGKTENREDRKLGSPAGCQAYKQVVAKIFFVIKNRGFRGKGPIVQDHTYCTLKIQSL
jgi:hypothetical protein